MVSSDAYGTVRSGISFGDFEGVVEWQDLIQGQVAMLMARKQAFDDKGKPYLHLVITAYSPVAFAFDDEIPHGALAGVQEMTQAQANPFTRALHACLRDDTLIEMSGALSEYQESRRRETQFRQAIESASDAKVNAFATAIVNLLIPTHFTDLPVPLEAAYALVADLRPQRKDEFSIAHLRVTSQALERIIEKAAQSELKALLAKCEADDPLKDLTMAFPLTSSWSAQQPGDFPRILSFQSNPKAGLLFLPEGGEKCEAIWWLHSRRSSSWPAEVKELAKQIHGPLSDILRIAEHLAGWSDDAPQVCKSWRSTLPLFAEYKLRDTLAAQYYSLATRVLYAHGEAEANQRLDEFRFLLRICAQFGGFADASLDEDKVVNACQKLKDLRKFVSEEASAEDTALVGATAFVRMRHRVLVDSGELPKKFRQLLPLLRIQQRCFSTSGAASVHLEPDNDGHCSEIELESLANRRFKGLYCGKPFTAKANDSFSDPVTAIDPRRTPQLTSWIAKEVGAGLTSPQIECKLRSYLGLTFSDLNASKYPERGDLQAILRVAFPTSHLGAHQE